MTIPTKIELMQYALEGIHDRIGSHPEPDNYSEEIEELEKHLDYVKRRIVILTLKRDLKRKHQRPPQ